MRTVNGLTLATLLIIGPTILATDPPDAAVNPQTGFIETASSSWTGSGYETRHTIDRGHGQPIVTFTVSSNAADDLDPRIEIDASGDTWVTWWRDLSTDQVRIRKLSFATQSWGDDRLVSGSAENARNPEIVDDGTSPWLVYEVFEANARSIDVGIIADEPDPFSGVILHTTSYTGDVDSQIESESGHLWVTWIDDSSHVGWCEYDYGTAKWSAAAFVSFSGGDTAAARAEIRAGVLGE